MAKALTAKSVEKATPLSETRREIPDALLTGLYLVVQPTGAKSWAVRYRHGGKPKKLTLGPYPALDLGKAREAAKDALQSVAAGGDPASRKQAAKEEARVGSNLFENVADEFLKRHRRKRDGQPLKSIGEVRRMLEHDVIPVWRGRLIQTITKRDVIQLLDGLTDRGVGPMTNRVFSVIRKLFNWATSRDIIQVSPCTGVAPPAAEGSRDRVLTDDEIRRFWKATGELGYPFGPLFRLMLVTGQREAECAGMPWSEVSLEKRLWSLPRTRTKNGRAHDVPLSDLAVEIIQGLPKIVGTLPLLFTTTGETPVSGFGRAKRNLDKGMTPDGAWKLHDLRRTMATGMQQLGIAPHVVEAVINHKSGIIKGVAAIYARHDYAAEKRVALEAWGRRLVAIVEGRAVSNVVSFPAAVA